MKIHLISDIHRETGPYALPTNLECDVIVAAGDVDNGLQGIQWLKTLGKPVVYVFGNHEYWSNKNNPVDMFHLVDQARADAAGSNIHFLENDAVVIDGTRFIGATLWTNFGGLNPSLLVEGQHVMKDYRHIYCPSFYSDKQNMEELYWLADEVNLRAGRRDATYKNQLNEFVAQGLFHPLVSYLLHQQTIKWISSQRFVEEGESVFDGKTIVVTHHHPYFESLRRCGVAEELLEPGRQFRIDRDSDPDLYKVACYASNVSIHNWTCQTTEPHHAWINSWMCGHLHEHIDYMKNGMRVVCNARGRFVGQLTPEKAKYYALFGASVLAEDIERSEQEFKANPYRGDGRAFDATFIVDINEGIVPVIRAEITTALPELEALYGEIGEFAAHVKSNVMAIQTAVRESIKVRADKFETLARTLEEHIAENLGYTFVHASTGLGIVSNEIHFTEQYFSSRPGSRLKRNHGTSARIDEINHLLKAQQIVIQKFMDFQNISRD